MKQFLDIHDVNDVSRLVDDALRFKYKPLAASSLGIGKTMVLLFLNPSLRTRLSTQKAAQNLGMQCMVMNMGQEGWQLEFEDGTVMSGDKAEHIKEAASVVSQYADVIGLRTFAGLTDRAADYEEKVLRAFTQYATVPVVNMESATVHPLQSLADLVTIRENQRSDSPKVVLTWAPHPRPLPQAVANSFAQWINATDAEFVIAHPKGFDLAPEFAGHATVTTDQRQAFEGADFVYAKNWSSYSNYGQPQYPLEEWMVDADKMALTNSAKFMHCLPVRRNVVVADEVIDSVNSLVIEQAGNRACAAQAVLYNLLQSA